MRLVVAALVLASCSPAQTKPDFSGIFLRTETEAQKHTTPAVSRILQVKQTNDEVVLTATQNGETAVVRYRLDSKKSDKVYAQLKGNRLVVKGTKTHHSSGPGLFPLGFSMTENLVETWELSSDGQRLVITTKANIGIPDSDIYIREPSMEAAQAADLAARRDCGGRSPISLFVERHSLRGEYGDGADLGIAAFQRLTRIVFYDAAISGDFFKHLDRTKEQGQPRFRKNGRIVTTYTGDIVLEVAPHPNSFSDEIGAWEPTGALPSDPVLNLRFMARWLGAEQKDLGEVESDFQYEPWRESNAPVAFYRMWIAAQDIPLADDLEVLIFSKTGEQLACIKGHL